MAIDKEKVIFGRPGNDVKMGIVGMPNIGKSTLFNFMSGLSVAAENYPFCTIEPSTARVKVPDKRFELLCNSYKPKRMVPAALTITDIAGLVKGASQNVGLGNEFLSHIYGVDGVFHLVRAFSNKTVEHVEGDVDPIRDIDIINEELRLKDIDILSKKVASMERIVKQSKDKFVKDQYSCFKKILKLLEEKKCLLAQKWTQAEINFINPLFLLTTKPVVFLVNVSLKNWTDGKNKWLVKIKEHLKKVAPGSPVIPFCARFETELIQMGEEKSKTYLKEKKLRSHASKIIKSGYSSLGLGHFFTCGVDEVKCWTIRKGTKVRKAAGVIHGDFEKFFVCAEVMAYEDYKEAGSEQAVKAKGKYRTEGKEYIVKDGDILLFKHTAGGAKKKR